MECDICCLACRSRAAVIPADGTNSIRNPYAVANLLPAGTLRIPFAETDPEISCDHRHGDSGWHKFTDTSIALLVEPVAHGQLCRQLAFLISHRFLVVTYRLVPLENAICLRVYVVPYDLANVQGQLRIRDETTVLKYAREYMKLILPLIKQDHEEWTSGRGECSPSSLSLFRHQQVKPFSPCFYSY